MRKYCLQYGPLGLLSLLYGCYCCTVVVYDTAYMRKYCLESGQPEPVEKSINETFSHQVNYARRKFKRSRVPEISLPADSAVAAAAASNGPSVTNATAQLIDTNTTDTYSHQSRHCSRDSKNEIRHFDTDATDGYSHQSHHCRDSNT